MGHGGAEAVGVMRSSRLDPWQRPGEFRLGRERDDEQVAPLRRRAWEAGRRGCERHAADVAPDRAFLADQSASGPGLRAKARQE